MTLPKFFCINGFGYLEGISFRESKCIARIKAIHASSQEDVWLDCEIQGILEDYLCTFLSEVQKGNIIILYFKAAYRKFGVSFFYNDPDTHTDEQIVILNCKLLSIGNCYINGSLIDKNDVRYLLAA